MNNITTIDKITKELDLIQDIYNIQFSKIDADSWIYRIFNEYGNPTDGRFINNFEICSEIELLNISSFKDEFTHRYENTQNTTLLKNQISKIRDKAASVLGFYNQNLKTGGIATDFYNHSKEIFEDAKAHYDYVRRHDALILVNEDYFISGMYFGCDSRCIDIEDFTTLPNRYEYAYSGNNFLLADICKSLIDFADDFLRTTTTESSVYLSSKKGMKIDYIRVINCLHELGFFTDSNGNSITKKQAFESFGTAINKNLEDYDKDLSRSLSDSTALLKHLEIFDSMREKMTEIFNSK